MKPLIYSILFFITNVYANKNNCPLPLSWEIKKVGTLLHKELGFTTDFYFLSEDEILLMNFPPEGTDKAPLVIFRKDQDVWKFDSKASLHLPKTFHPRHVFKKDIDGDKHEEIIISDHGTDKPPFSGAKTIILRKKKWWQSHPLAKIMPISTNFNSAVLNWGKNSGAIFRASMKPNDSTLFEFNKKWVNTTSTLPEEFTKTEMCMMTTLSEDFDGDGSDDLFLGGCDKNQELILQRHDRILTKKENKLVLLPMEILPPRRDNATWGTVYVEKIFYNTDSKPDIIVATHDFGFHDWKVVIYENHSIPGQFSFKEIPVQLFQEEHTEGFLNSFEIASFSGLKNFIFADIRSVVRDKNKVHPKRYIRLLVQEKESLVDLSHCLPQEISSISYKMRRIPNTNNEFLFVPFNGDLIHLKVRLNKSN